jgi:hypothetical protein
MFSNLKPLRSVSFTATLVVAFSALAQDDQPGTGDPADPNPSYQYDLRPHHQVPFLGGTGDLAQQSALAFVDYAGFSMVDERDDVARALAGASQNREVAQALCDEAFNSLNTDHTRALLVLSLLGEMRNPLGADCLNSFLWLPLPDDGTISEGGEIVERTSLSILEAKAVEGLAYLRNAAADQVVLQAVASHPSRNVRASAIDAFKWNHGDSADAIQILLRYVRADEWIFLDRIRRESGETADTFNAKLARYLTQHPEVIPPDPEPGEMSDPQDPDDAFVPPVW